MHWIENIDDSWIAIVNNQTCNKIRTWCTGQPGLDYWYNERLKMIFSSHRGGILIGWNLNGKKLCETVGAGDVVYAITCHPSQDKILSGSNDLIIREWSVTKTSIELCNVIKDQSIYQTMDCGNWSVRYDTTGTRVLSTEPTSRALRIYSLGKI